ncbi:hypothetical protein S40285_01494 [Stachybotrys chlorohalonatus IBT 40285]|uniref:Kelch repeat protein n=1 Tax=Stachybotrys chlorohalonatus (strain IBT 40285) TaxID=1283841 RepID=A0A084QMI6_STAC4|nr:hypothetical protein S40285_01494 [Stachybotrys chlorohalonata IBT 40285]
MGFTAKSFAAHALLALPTTAQLLNWLPNQVNTSICTWDLPRAAIVRDTIYLDGGELWWTRGLDDGDLGSPSNNGSSGFSGLLCAMIQADYLGNPEGIVMTYNLSRPFSPGANLTGLLLQDTLTTARGGQGMSSEGEITGGAMFASQGSFYLYGGLPYRRSQQRESSVDVEVLGYDIYQYGASRPTNLMNSWFVTNLPANMTEYIAYGGAASAPSENKAWYFSGLTSPSRGPIYWLYDTETLSDLASEPSDTFITVDMEVQNGVTWRNETLDGVRPRSDAQVVWVPVGEEGILVVLGGLTNPTRTISDSERLEEIVEESAEFMQNVDIYDVANNAWYQQSTEDTPPGTRSRGCAVVATASDESSFNIYYYGGFDGVYNGGDFYDDVWVLSMPSFTWTQVNEGTALHARAGHRCFTPYPDQMMVFGGQPAPEGGSRACIEEPIVLFNLTSAEWMSSYDPSHQSTYGVPQRVHDKIGGDAIGGATMRAPSSGWDSSELESLFETPYDMDKIQQYWPYAPESTPSQGPDGREDEDDNSGGGGLPSWVAPVIGVVLGLALLIFIGVMFLFWKRRSIFRNRQSEAGTDDLPTRIRLWMKGQPVPPPEKDFTTTSTVISSDSRTMSPKGSGPTTVSVVAVSPEPQELCRELETIPAAVELDGMCNVKIPDRLSNSQLLGNVLPVELQGRNESSSSQQTRSSPRLQGNANHFTAFNNYFQGSNIGDAAHSNGPVEIGQSQEGEWNQDSPTVVRTPQSPQVQERVLSGVSEITTASHMRNLSDMTVSTADNQGGMVPTDTAMGSGAQNDMHVLLPRVEEGSMRPLSGPISPPSANEAPGEDYLSARASLDTPKPSASKEHEDRGNGGK